MDGRTGFPVTAEWLASIMLRIAQCRSYSPDTRRSAMAVHLLALDLVHGGHGGMEAIAGSRRRRSLS